MFAWDLFFSPYINEECCFSFFSHSVMQYCNMTGLAHCYLTTAFSHFQSRYPEILVLLNKGFLSYKTKLYCVLVEFNQFLIYASTLFGLAMPMSSTSLTDTVKT